jgi:hypothetical protein
MRACGGPRAVSSRSTRGFLDAHVAGRPEAWTRRVGRARPGGLGDGDAFRQPARLRCARTTSSADGPPRYPAHRRARPAGGSRGREHR